MWKRLWLDEGGAILSTEMILILVIAVIGLIVGLTALRDAVDLQLTDIAGAIASVDPSYSWTGLSYVNNEVSTGIGSRAYSAGSSYQASVKGGNWPQTMLSTVYPSSTKGAGGLP
jgi:hypothetical protein